ncbi:MAG: FAD-binding protein [Planctomycetota bacterium]
MTAALEPATKAELCSALAETSCPVRLCGTGSRLARRAADGEGAVRISLRRISGIERLDAEDLTCSVAAGLPRAELDEALAERGLELACPGAGTLGGLFASDPIGPETPRGPCPRSLLLGLEGVLAEGKAFRSGARVVKSVAGFDLHKLFVGSGGRLFAATLLHLRLRPRPRARTYFRTAPSSAADSLGLFARLCREPVPPETIRLVRAGGNAFVEGSLAGRPEAIRRFARRFGLREVERIGPDSFDPEGHPHTLDGVLAPSRLGGFLEALPAGSPFVVRGGGRLSVALADGEAQRMLSVLAEHQGHGVLCSRHAAVDGAATPRDEGALRLEQAVKRALDPRGKLR